MNILKRVFRAKTQGADFVKKWDAKEGTPTVKRTATLAGVGAGTGALVGLASGGIAAKLAINKVPYQEVTVNHLESVKQRELMGYIPPDDYERGTWRPSDDGHATEPVYRDNPVYGPGGSPHLRETSTTFRGRGTPSPVDWRTENIEHHKMNERDPYDYRTVEDTETYLSHYETVTKYRDVPYSDTETYQDCSTSYNADGSSSYDCDTETRTVTKYRSESYTEQEPVYRERTVGFWQRYSENIDSRVVGNVEKPNVTFDHGVNVGGYLIKGLVYGAAIGALAGGITAALEERFFPNTLPGYEPKTGKPGDPIAPPYNGQPPAGPVKPEPPAQPAPPSQPEHDCGGRTRHTHDNANVRHTHSSADRWHYHGCPDGAEAFDESVICFKETNVPVCYLDDTPTKSCDSNDSVCYIAHD
jgi:hypothetical protein